MISCILFFNAVQKYADVVAVTDVELLELVPIGHNRGARVNDLHPFLRLEALREVPRESREDVRVAPVPIDDDEPRGFRGDVLPCYRGGFRCR